MCEQIIRTTAVILCGLAVGIIWSMGFPRQLGELVPEDIAAAQRGGDTCVSQSFPCANRIYDFCYDATFYNPDCKKQNVWYQDPYGEKYKLEGCVYCGKLPTECAKFSDSIPKFCTSLSSSSSSTP